MMVMKKMINISKAHLLEISANETKYQMCIQTREDIFLTGQFSVSWKHFIN